MNPFYTIVIPTLDSGNTVSAAIESILKQSNKDFEILIIDGLSSDNTLAISRNYEDERVKISSGKDMGIYDAMNKGIKCAKGEWLYFMGADDRLFDDQVLSNVAAEIEKTYDLIVYGNVQIVGNCPWGLDGDIYAGQFDLRKLLKQNISHQAIFYNKSVFRDMGLFNINYKINSDWDFNLHCFSKLKFHFFEQTVAFYAAGGISSGNVDSRYYHDRLRNIIAYFQNQLYKDEFIEERYSFRKMLLKKNSGLGFGVKTKLFLSMILLQAKAWQERFFGRKNISAD
jgi:glycosyltransferase involved in cell wall biosynthesis